MADEIQIRCFCSRHTLLAIGGRDTRDHSPYIHIKSMKNQRIVTEVVVTSGIVRIRCRDCLRWHTIKIVKENIKYIEEKLPESIAI